MTANCFCFSGAKFWRHFGAKTWQKLTIVVLLPKEVKKIHVVWTQMLIRDLMLIVRCWETILKLHKNSSIPTLSVKIELTCASNSSPPCTLLKCFPDTNCIPWCFNCCLSVTAYKSLTVCTQTSPRRGPQKEQTEKDLVSFVLCFHYHHSHCYDVVPSDGL